MAGGEHISSDRAAEAFISYSHEDREFALGLRDELQRHDKRAWVDEQEIRPAALWADDVKRAIEGADSYIFVISPTSVVSPHCLGELEHADLLHKRILPVNYRTVPEADIPALLAARQFIPARGEFGAGPDDSFAQLLMAIDTDLDWVRLHTDWGQKAAEWDRHDQDRSYRLSGTELDAAEAWLAGQSGKDPEPTALQRQFVLASRVGATRRLRTILGGVGAALVVAIVLAVLALVQRAHADYERDVALATSLRGSSQAQEPTNPMLAAQLAAEADARQPGNEQSQEVLRTALAGLREIGHLSRGHFADLARNGRTALTYGNAGLTQKIGDGYLWELPSRRLLATVSDTTSAGFVQLAQRPEAGQGAAFSTTAGKIDVLNPATGHTIRVIPTGLPTLSGFIAAASAPLVIALDSDEDCEVVDVATGHVSSEIKGCTEPDISPHGTAMAYSPNGSDTRLTVLDRMTGRAHTITLAGNDATSVTFPTDKAVAVSDGFKGLSVYDLSGRAMLRLPNVQSPVFTPDAKTMVATLELGDNSSVVSTYAFPSGKLEGALMAIPGNIPDDVELSGDGSVAAIAEDQLDLVTLVDIQSGRTLATLQGDTNITDVALDQTASRLLTGNGLGSASGTSATPDVWNGPAEAARVTLTLHSIPQAPSLALTPDGASAWLTTADGACHIRFQARAASCARGYFANGAIAPDGSRAVALYQETAPPAGGPSEDAAIYAFGPAGARLVKLIPPPASNGDYIGAIALSPDGALAATADSGNVMQIWRTADGRQFWKIKVPTLTIDDLAWSGDGTQLVVAGENGMWLYDMSTRKLLRRFSPPPNMEPKASQDVNCDQDYDESCPSYSSPVMLGHNRVLANDSRVDMELFDTATGHRIATITPPGRFDSSLVVTGSRDGSTFAVSTNEGVVRTYSAADGAPTGEPLDLPPVDSSGLLPITLTGGGRVVVTLDDGRLDAWQVSTGALLLQQNADMFAAADDGAVLATLSGSSLATFSCQVCGDPALLLPDARRLIAQGLSPAERAIYLAGEPDRFN